MFELKYKKKENIIKAKYILLFNSKIIIKKRNYRRGIYMARLQSKKPSDKDDKKSKGLITKSTQNVRSIINNIRLKRFAKKYGDILFEYFGIMNSLDNYEFLINFFGEKNLKKALDNSELTACQIADTLLTPENKEAFYNASKTNYSLSKMVKHIIFNRITGLNMSFYTKGIYPDSFSRTCYGINQNGEENRRTILDVWKDNNISKDDLKEIYEIYGSEIVSQYNDDMVLRNKTILMTDDKYKEAIAVGGLQDHVTDYSEDDFKTILDKYFNGKELQENERYILMGLLVKITDLISIYSAKYLKEQPDYIKAEIRVGIFQDIVLRNKSYTNDERKMIVQLDGIWNSDDLARYDNLLLLKERIPSLYSGEELENRIACIDDILSKPIEDVVKQADDIAESMSSLYMQYEIDNREKLIEKVYNPENQGIVIIDDLSKMGFAAMLHFFDPSRKVSNFDSYIKELEEERSKQLGRKITFSEEEKKKMKLQYLAKENHFITDYTLDWEAIGQVTTFDERYVTNTSNQLCALIASPEAILNGRGIRGGNIALRFI